MQSSHRASAEPYERKIANRRNEKIAMVQGLKTVNPIAMRGLISYSKKVFIVKNYVDLWLVQRDGT